MIKLTLSSGSPVWFNPRKIQAITMVAAKSAGERGTKIYTDAAAEGWWQVKEDTETVIARIKEFE